MEKTLAVREKKRILQQLIYKMLFVNTAVQNKKKDSHWVDNKNEHFSG